MVLGAGIFGSALAFHLARQGLRSVLLYDAVHPTYGASGKGAGILCSQCWDPWDIRVVEETREEYRGLAKGEPTVEFEENGSIRMIRTAGQEELLRERQRQLTDAGVESSWLTPDGISERLPGISVDGLRAALYTPHDAVVSAPGTTFRYAELALSKGVEVEWDRGTGSLRRERDAWLLTTRTGVARSPRVVIACGAWTKGVLGTLGHALPLAPYRTQAALLEPPVAQGSFPSVHDTDLDVYVRPYPGGHLLAGDGTQLREVDPDRVSTGSDWSFLEDIARAFHVRFPRWRESRVRRSWAGVCVATPDRHPLVGPVPGADGLFVAAGFNGFGVMRAGGLARRMAESLQDGDWGRLSPCLPARFRSPAKPFLPRPGFTLEANE